VAREGIGSKGRGQGRREGRMDSNTGPPLVLSLVKCGRLSQLSWLLGAL